MVFLVKRYSKKAVPDDYPSEQQKRESFQTPNDYISTEYPHVKNNDIDYYLRLIERELDYADNILSSYKHLLKMYRKYDAMSHSSITRRRKRAAVKKEELFEEIVRIYARLGKLKYDIVVAGGVGGKY
ncbi:hypothetical protein [Thermoplasma volcanium]|nr:hypothetical protein [Thermoplasma volcanium]